MTKIFQNKNFNTLFVIGAVVLVAVLRLIPHPSNFAPLAAIALFSGACLRNKGLAIVVTLLSLIISDALVNHFIYGMDSLNPFYSGFYIVYGASLIVVLLGFIAKKQTNVKNIVVLSLCGSIIFFLTTNFGVFYGSKIYAQNAAGLIACYTAALPYFQNSIIGDLFFNGLLFGSYFAVTNYSQKLVAVKA